MFGRNEDLTNYLSLRYKMATTKPGAPLANSANNAAVSHELIFLIHILIDSRS